MNFDASSRRTLLSQCGKDKGNGLLYKRAPEDALKMGGVSRRGDTKVDPEEEVPARCPMATSVPAPPQGPPLHLQAPWLPRASCPVFVLKAQVHTLVS